MSIINNNLLLAGTDEGYNPTRSLRFRSSASAYLNRTPASAGNRQTWTWSAWVKRGTLGSYVSLFSAYDGTSNNDGIAFDANNKLQLYSSNGAATFRLSTAVYRDTASWYHIVVTSDTTNATAQSRAKVWVNGSEITAWDTNATITQNLNWNGYNTTNQHNIGRYVTGGYNDAYLAGTYFIDGQALTPSSFGETDLITGVWKPKRYAGTYGTNGFYLPFTDNSALTTSSNAGLGKDFSGNGNYWTTNNISITSGVTYDSMTDVPTLTSATAANYCVLNPLQPASTTVVIPTDGNLKMTGTPSGNNVTGTMAIGTTTYFEGTVIAGGGTVQFGIKNLITGSVYVYDNSGVKSLAGSSSAYGASFTTNDIIGVAVDPTNLTLQFYKNGVSQGVISAAFPSGSYVAFFYASNANSSAANFGQRPFSYTPPTGFVALNTYNLPTPTIVKGNTVMDATTWTGTSATQTITNSGFKPDLIWIKNRGVAVHHVLMDSVRGFTTGKKLESDGNYAEGDASEGQDWAGYVTGATSTGFTLDKSGTGANDYVHTNKSANTYVGWQWQAGQGTTSSNTSGTITSTVSVNASAGFSVVTYTGNGTNGATVGHGLGVAPSLVIYKIRSSTVLWVVYSQARGNTGFLPLNQTDAFVTDSTVFNNTSPTSSVLTLGTSGGTNSNTNTYVAYCFAPIAGYSAFGTYTGNGSTDGTFVYTGFRPKYVMKKRTDSTGSWYINDSVRDAYNVAGLDLYADLSSAEVNESPIMDFLSNGFKLRTSGGALNASGGTYQYLAFAENPFKNALAR